ncbi:uncharacterized protein B0J16DRAFT_371975 [Fusarium flagelliforme]|uniref:uncharacterized protein n=1 Tax=Fusarium flagelliforme TaxID=2675880 RepID=UPI001E8EB09B|nr:uncharacterized protein B0J16DRAFT_371975 [Fusarium flagelliforme]KAH7185129.1 hypothetical protein B0J16DRAFT_371975 [Fusarium flagelliforme]
MIFSKLSVAAAAIALSGQAIASPCKPISQSATISVETSATSESLATETSSLAATSLSTEASTAETSTAETATASSTLTSETLVAIDVTTTTASSMTEQTTLETTITILESSSETTTGTDDFTTEAATTTADATTTDASTLEATTSSSAPQCTFTGAYTNYVSNPSFDDHALGNTDPWISLGTPWHQGNVGRGGGSAMAIKFPDPPFGASFLQPLQGVVAGREYVLTYYFQLAEGSPLASDECRIGASAGSGGQTRRWVQTDGEEAVQPGQYNKQQFRITAENDDQRLGIGFFCDTSFQGETRVYIDDVSVYDYYEGCEDPTEVEVPIIEEY